ncbi:MAG: flagellar protein FlgN [Bdellovibrionia bacterium]
MEKLLQSVHQSLKRLTGLHCQLLELVREEKTHLLSADLAKIGAVSKAKLALCEEIHQVEYNRLKCIDELAMVLKKPVQSLKLHELILSIQTSHPELAASLQSSLNALTHLVSRISEQNADNQLLLQQALSHVQVMKKNAISEASMKSSTYTHQGNRSQGVQASHLISREI